MKYLLLALALTYGSTVMADNDTDMAGAFDFGMVMDNDYKTKENVKGRCTKNSSKLGFNFGFSGNAKNKYADNDYSTGYSPYGNYK